MLAAILGLFMCLSPLVASSGCAHISCVPDSVLQGSYGGGSGTYYDVNSTTGVCDVITTWWGGNTVSCFIGSSQLSGFPAQSHVLLAWPKVVTYSVTSVWSANAGFATLLVDDDNMVLVKFAVDKDITSSLEIGFTIYRDNEVQVDASTFSGSFEMRTDSPPVESTIETAATNVESLFSGTCKSIETFDRGNTVECSLLTVRVESYPAGTSIVLKFAKPNDVVVVGLPWSLQTDPIHFQYAQSESQVKFVVKTDWSASRYLKIRFQVRRQNAYSLDGKLFKSFVFLTDLARAKSPSVTSKTVFKAYTADDLKAITDDSPVYFKIVSKLTQTIVNSQTVDIVKVTFRSIYYGWDVPAKFTSFKMINYRSDWPVQYFNQTDNVWVDLSSTTATTFKTGTDGVLILSFRTNDILDTAAVVMNWDFRIAEDPVFLLLKTQIAYELQRVDQDLKSNSVNQQLRTELIAQIGASSLPDFAATYLRLTKDFLDGDPCGNTEVYVDLPENLYIASPLTSSSCSAKSTRFRGLGLFDSAGDFFSSIGNAFVSVGNGIASGVQSIVQDQIITPAVTFGNNVKATFANFDGKLVDFVGTVIASSEFQQAAQWVVQGYDGVNNIIIKIKDGFAMVIKTIADGWNTFVKLIVKGVQIIKELIEVLFNQDDVKRTYRMMKHMMELSFNTMGDFMKAKEKQIQDSFASTIDWNPIETTGLNQFEQYMSQIDDSSGFDLGIVGEAVKAVSDKLDSILSIDFEDFDYHSILTPSQNYTEDQFDTANFPKASSTSEGLYVSQAKTTTFDSGALGRFSKKVFTAFKDFGIPDVFPFNYVNHLCSQLLGGDTCSFYNIILFAGAEIATIAWKTTHNLQAPFDAAAESSFLSQASLLDLLPWDAPTPSPTTASPTIAPTTESPTTASPTIASVKADAFTAAGVPTIAPSIAPTQSPTTAIGAYSEYFCKGEPNTLVSADVRKSLPKVFAIVGALQGILQVISTYWSNTRKTLPCQITPDPTTALTPDKILKILLTVTNFVRAFPAKTFNDQHSILVVATIVDFVGPFLAKDDYDKRGFMLMSGIMHVSQAITAGECYTPGSSNLSGLWGTIMHSMQVANRVQAGLCTFQPIKTKVQKSTGLQAAVIVLELLRLASVEIMVIYQLATTPF